MSFILDAIAKSERERQQQEIPDARILATPVSELRRPRRIFPYLVVVGALLLNVIVVLIWMQTDESPFNGHSQTENSTIEPDADNQIAPGKVAPENGTSKVENANSAATLNQDVEIDSAMPQTARAKSSTQDLVPQSTKSVILDKSLAKTKAETPPRVENVQARSVDKLEMAPSQKITENSDGKSNSSIPVEPNIPPDVIGGVDEVKPTDTQNVEDPAPRKVFSLSELPADVRRDLPSVSFTGHLFSKNVNVSYVMVDGGRSVIAGQQIADDLFLHEVTPAGAIVDFRGFLIEVGILQNWSLK